jgi:hypothetical protein
MNSNNTTNTTNTTNGNSDSYQVPQVYANSFYHEAENLARSDHGMSYQGGINGGWTHPTKGDPLAAAELMQVSADLRQQSINYYNNADRGHVTAQQAAQLAANGIRGVQALVSSINPQQDNSGSSYNSNNYSTQSNYQTWKHPSPGQTWTSGNTTYSVNEYGSVKQTSKCWRCGSIFDSSQLGTHCM